MALKAQPYHHADLRSKLLETAARLLAEKGVEDVTLRELARRSGVSRTAPYRHFKDKTALLAAVAEDGFNRLSDRCRKAGRESAVDPIANLEKVFIAYVEFAVENPTHYRLMFGRKVLPFMEYPGLAAAAGATYGELVSLVRQCQQAGKIQSGSSVNHTHFFWSMAHGISSLVIDGRIQPAGTLNKLLKFSFQSMMSGVLR